jgi:lysophospholipase L1-like esterase
MTKKVLLVVLFLIAGKSMAQTLTINNHVRFLALGDSYTIGQSVPQNERWPVQLIQQLRNKGLTCPDAKIIATTGWRTDQLKSAIENANLSPEYTLVALLIGVNNQYQGKSVQDYAPEFEGLLNKAIALANGVKSHVFVVSIPDYGYTPFGESNQPAISAGINAYNEVNRTITEKSGVKYFNITPISRRGLTEPDLVASDGLHPSGKMYQEWVELILAGASISVEEGNNGEGENVTGIENERFGIKLFPNPFQSTLTLENLLYLEQPVKFTLIDATGSTALRKEMLQLDRIEFDTTMLSTGLYNYQLEDSSGEVITGKLIKQ